MCGATRVDTAAARTEDQTDDDDQQDRHRDSSNDLARHGFAEHRDGADRADVLLEPRDILLGREVIQ